MFQNFVFLLKPKPKTATMHLPSHSLYDEARMVVPGPRKSIQPWPPWRKRTSTLSHFYRLLHQVLFLLDLHSVNQAFMLLFPRLSRINVCNLQSKESFIGLCLQVLFFVFQLKCLFYSSRRSRSRQSINVKPEPPLHPDSEQAKL